MNKDTYDKALDRVIALKVKASDIYYDEVLKPILDTVKNPEKVIGKQYEEWTPMDKQLLTQVYQSNPKILQDFVVGKEYNRILVLEKGA